jgi:hypothetical protein
MVEVRLEGVTRARACSFEERRGLNVVFIY